MAWYAAQGGVYEIQLQPGGPTIEPDWSVGQEFQRRQQCQGKFESLPPFAATDGHGIRVVEDRSPYNGKLRIYPDHFGFEANSLQEALLMHYERVAKLVAWLIKTHGWAEIKGHGLRVTSEPHFTVVEPDGALKSQVPASFLERENMAHDLAIITGQRAKARAA